MSTEANAQVWIRESARPLLVRCGTIDAQGNAHDTLRRVEPTDPQYAHHVEQARRYHRDYGIPILWAEPGDG